MQLIITSTLFLIDEPLPTQLIPKQRERIPIGSAAWPTTWVMPFLSTRDRCREMSRAYSGPANQKSARCAEPTFSAAAETYADQKSAFQCSIEQQNKIPTVFIYNQD